MELDAFDLFGKSHRIYVHGVRSAIRERLEFQFADEWWEKGVLASFRDEWTLQLDQIAKAREPEDYQSVLDNRHFGYIVSMHHESAFRSAFPDSQRAFTRFRQLTTVRNDWAHFQEISLGRFRQAADMMQDILAALNREEALDVEKIRREAMTEPAANVAEEPIEEADLESQPSEPKSVLAEPVESWRRLRSYLQVEREVSIEETSRGRIAQISVKLANTAPESPDWPSVVFRTITLAGTGIETKSIYTLRPGETAEVDFRVPEARLLSFELSLSAAVDGDELLKFQHRAELPTDATAAIKKRFAADFEGIGVKGFVTEAVETVGKANESLSMREMAGLRESARAFSSRADKVLNDLNGVFRAYGIQREDTLGSRMRELNTTLTNFKKTVEEFDQAVGETDPDKMQQVQDSLKAAQLAVLRIEAELRSVGG